MDILCVGLMVCDIIAKPVDSAVFERDSSRLDSLKIAPGGDALNAAVNLAKLGLQVVLAGKVGKDPLGEYLVAEARDAGVHTDGIRVSDECSTSVSLALVEASGERHFIYYGEANDSFCVRDIALGFLGNNTIVHLGSAMALGQLDGAGIEQLFREAKGAGATTSMDVTWDCSGKWLEKIDGALHSTDIFMPSLYEAQLISGKEGLEDIEAFFARYGIQVLAVKLGDRGCLVTDFAERHTIPAFGNVQVVDTTGAGDAFVSGFLAGTVRGLGLHERGVLANAVAAHCVTQMGATAGTRGWDETMDFIRGST